MTRGWKCVLLDEKHCNGNHAIKGPAKDWLIGQNLGVRSMTVRFFFFFLLYGDIVSERNYFSLGCQEIMESIWLV